MAPTSTCREMARPGPTVAETDLSRLLFQCKMRNGTGLFLASGSSSTGSSGSVSLTVGGTATGSGGSILLNSGPSPTGTGGNIYLKPGDGSSDGSVYFVDPSTNANYGVISQSTFDFSGQSTMSMSFSGSVDIASSTTITIQGTAGVDFGDSYAYGFETGTATVGTEVSGEIALNTMTGVLTSEFSNLGAGVTDSFEVVNTRVNAESIVIVTVRNDGGCEPFVMKVEPASNRFFVSVKNIAATACTSAFTLNFMVVN